MAPLLFGALSKSYSLVKTKDKKESAQLERNGRFRSIELRALCDEADFIFTKPTFSLFREFITICLAKEKTALETIPLPAITLKLAASNLNSLSPCKLAINFTAPSNNSLCSFASYNLTNACNCSLLGSLPQFSILLSKEISYLCFIIY